MAASDTAVHYSTHEQRGQEAMEAAGILPNCKGCAGHDHWKPYWAYEGFCHALCNAHHLRERRYCEESTGHGWPIALRRWLVEGQEAVAAAQTAGRDAVRPRAGRDPPQTR